MSKKIAPVFTLISLALLSAGADTVPREPVALAAKPFRNRVAGLEFTPPAGGVIKRSVSGGDLVEFVYPDAAWNVRAHEIPLHAKLQSSLLDAVATQFKETNPTARVLASRQAKIGPYDVGLIEATYKVGTTDAYAQMALFERDQTLFYQLQLTTPGWDDKAAAADVAVKRRVPDAVFRQMLDTVHLLDREAFKKDQRAAEKNGEEFLKTLDEAKLESVLVPQHFMRVVEGGRDVGFVQVDERTSRNMGYGSVEVIVRSRVENSVRVASAETAAPPTSDAGGVVIPKSLQPDAGINQPLKPTNVYMWSSYYMAYDRSHESWTSAAQIDDRKFDQVTEEGDSNLVIRRGLDRRVRQEGGKQPAIIEFPDYSLDVTQQLPSNQQKAAVQNRNLGHTFHIPLAPIYIPQALGQLLPRVLPLEKPRQFLFTYYVGDVHETLTRYVEVGEPTATALDGKSVEAIPVTDRIGADGITTVHYMTRAGEWLGSINEETRTVVLPTDYQTLHDRWGFLICPLPANDEDNQPKKHGTTARPGRHP